MTAVMTYMELFSWWVISIVWSSVFLVGVSIYLYVDKLRRLRGEPHASVTTLAGDFVFVWVLLGLLGLYIASISVASSVLFAAGNLVVEALLLAYIVRVNKV